MCDDLVRQHDAVAPERERLRQECEARQPVKAKRKPSPSATEFDDELGA